MDAELARIAASQGGIFYRWQALECGYRSKEVTALLRCADWQPLRRGAYATKETLKALDTTGRYLLTVRAAVGSLTGTVVVSHYSALAALGVPLWGVNLGEVHVHRDDGKSARRAAGVAHHLGVLPDHEVIEVDGLLVTVPERSLVDACRETDFEAGVVLADGAHRLSGFDGDLARGILERQRDWPGSVGASRVLQFADPRAQTVGESRCRVLLARIGSPVPVTQYEIRDSGGRLLGIVDFLIREYDTVVEFDGRQKYGREMYERTGQIAGLDLGDIVWREKRREDALRAAGYEVVRIVWSELDGHDAIVRARLEAAFARTAVRSRGA